MLVEATFSAATVFGVSVISFSFDGISARAERILLITAAPAEPSTVLLLMAIVVNPLRSYLPAKDHNLESFTQDSDQRTSCSSFALVVSDCPSYPKPFNTFLGWQRPSLKTCEIASK